MVSKIHRTYSMSIIQSRSKDEYSVSNWYITYACDTCSMYQPLYRVTVAEDELWSLVQRLNPIPLFAWESTHREDYQRRTQPHHTMMDWWWCMVIDGMWQITSCAGFMGTSLELVPVWCSPVLWRQLQHVYAEIDHIGVWRVYTCYIIQGGMYKITQCDVTGFMANLMKTVTIYSNDHIPLPPTTPIYYPIRVLKV